MLIIRLYSLIVITFAGYFINLVFSRLFLKSWFILNNFERVKFTLLFILLSNNIFLNIFVYYLILQIQSGFKYFSLPIFQNFLVPRHLIRSLLKLRNSVVMYYIFVHLFVRLIFKIFKLFKKLSSYQLKEQFILSLLFL